MNLVAGLIPLFVLLILVAVVITLARRKPQGGPSRHPRPANDDQAFIQGMIVNQTLFNQPGQAESQPHPHVFPSGEATHHPLAPSPSPLASEFHHTLPHASSPTPHAFSSGEAADTSGPSPDSGSFDGGSSHSHH